MRVFLDANILFSAAQQGSPSQQLIHLLSGHAVLTTHSGVWEEAERNVRAKRPQWTAGLPQLARQVLVSSVIGPCPSVDLPPKDQPVLGAAIALQVNWLITGDRTHFGHLFGMTIKV